MKDSDSRNGILRPTPRPSTGRSGMKPGLTALGTAAVVGIYAAGFTLTREAAHGLDGVSGDASRPTALAVDPAGGASLDDNGGEVGESESNRYASENRERKAEDDETATAAPTAGLTGQSASSAEAASSPGAGLAVSPAAGPGTLPGAPSPGNAGASGTGPTMASAAASASARAVEPAAPPSSEADRPTSPPASSSGSAPAATSAAAESAPSPADAESPFLDGLYTAWGIRTGHGTIEAAVEISGGRIVSVVVSTCRMRWPCTDVDPMIPRMIRAQRPSVPVITGATQSSDAFSTAVTEALAMARAAKSARTTQ